MPDSTPTVTGQPFASAEPLPLEDGLRRNGSGRDGAPPGQKPKVRKLRLFFVLAGLSALALISTIFGMMMAVANELPSLENKAEFRAARNSTLLADNGASIARLTGNQNRILVSPEDISPNIKNAVIAIEDKRYYQHKGVDFRGIGRAVIADLTRQKAVQGGSTITQQFVKNALAAQNNRTVFEKLREAALAYHLERQWSKQKILGEYLNTIYFGNGAYGVESAMRTYFGGPRTHYDPNERRASNATPDQAALLAGMIASPSGYDPIQNPRAALERRNLVLKLMLEQHSLSTGQYDQAVQQALPTAQSINPPRPDSSQPYFSTWVTQQLVDRYGSGRVFGGGLKIRTSIDPQFQAAAVQAINGRLAGVGPGASLVMIDNKTGEIKAMVGGGDYANHPFNIATNAHRQPGSAFKPFILVEALEKGIGPGTVWPSGPKVFNVSKREKFVVHNYENRYSGQISLANATAFSDNSVYAEIGIKLGTKKIARLARRMGLHTKVSSNLAMTLGGLKTGLNPLELAYAYSTIANGGKRVTGTLPAWKNGPVAVEDVRTSDGKRIDHDKRRSIQVFPQNVAETAKQLLRGVVEHGTGTAAQLPNDPVAGKTGTTENYGDAWFVGFDDRYTVAVWVGYPDRLKPMKTEYHGKPVAGGTFPTEIWHDFMAAVLNIRKARNPKDVPGGATGTTTGPSVPYSAPAPPPSGGAAPPTQQAPKQTPKQQTQPKQGGGDTTQQPDQGTQQPQQDQPPSSGGTGGGTAPTVTGTG
jgi:penicillin-binding protein 1A